MSKKYLKNEKGIVRAITTENLQLEKPLLNEYYDINVHNRNSDKIDSAIKGINIRIDNIRNDVADIELLAKNVKMENGTNVEDNINSIHEQIGNNITRAKTILQSLSSKIEGWYYGIKWKTYLKRGCRWSRKA